MFNRNQTYEIYFTYKYPSSPEHNFQYRFVNYKIRKGNLD